MLGRTRVLMGLTLLIAACATPVQYAVERDANDDVQYGASDPRPPRGGFQVGGGGSDAGHDAATVVTGCDARILVLFDRSSSMQTEWSGGGTTGPRWQVAETTLTNALTPHESQLTIGAILFPSSESMSVDGTCAPVDPIASQMPFQSGPAFLTAWTARWTTPNLLGSTPIDAAFDSADAALAGAGAETAVVLLTDGEPTCANAITASMHAATWRTRGIPTYVVGLPGSSAGTSYLAGIATAGGTAPISVDDPSALGTALSNIAGTQIDHQCMH